MRIKAIILAGVLTLSLLCACGNTKGSSSNEANSYHANTETAVFENSTASGNFSDPVFIENPGTDTVIVEMP